MKMKTQKIGDTVVVVMDGKLDFGTAEPLREDLSKLSRNLVATDESARKVIFNLDKLEFVGSSGISSFVQALKEFNDTVPNKPRYCHVKSEFKRIIKAFADEESFEFYENEDRARKSFEHEN